MRNPVDRLSAASVRVEMAGHQLSELIDTFVTGVTNRQTVPPEWRLALDEAMRELETAIDHAISASRALPDESRDLQTGGEAVLREA
jgi:hypothetical protein